MFENIIFYGLIILAICILVKTIGVKNIKDFFKKSPQKQTNTEQPGNEPQINLVPEKSENETIKNTLSFINLWLFIIAIALCIIAFCQFQDYYYKKQIINTTQNTLDQIYQYIN